MTKQKYDRKVFIGLALYMLWGLFFAIGMSQGKGRVFPFYHANLFCMGVLVWLCLVVRARLRTVEKERELYLHRLLLYESYEDIHRPESTARMKIYDYQGGPIGLTKGDRQW